ncbi:acetyl-CoA carboxylase biotin carboxyl carrier protein subunit [Plantactinospora sp. KLBMP9567]|uniref:acetyl-CoA carboxylase biotin carboxyl carrier protein n=1 Tax=Plantactinospora sp. KLBMP9567 TaxID=3085900 RepID=UPI0029829D66|nr:acetyl-CoA carboxylase biotin carboxyl carrier protein subunit [Plantactinospora sp. KLBMP9567]MDW5329443.1 acetyl-CoA carboxylase biotin carboxyl carrier protein subunit [Plantactinospora sp. KLBMP9567]
MSEKVREPAAVRAANGAAQEPVSANDPPSPPEGGNGSRQGTASNGARPVGANGTGPAIANGAGAHGVEPAGPTDTALRSAVRAAAEVAELVRDPAIRRVRVTVADVRIEVEGAEGGREAIVTVTGEAASVPDAVLSAVPGAAVAPVPGAAVAAAVAPPAGTVPVTAPLMGVFYRSPGPDQPPFAEIGQRVEAGDQVAIVEAMKMMNPVLTDRGGIVRAVHVTDGEVVEYEQPLLSIEPG